jgi:hypothetical protein
MTEHIFALFHSRNKLTAGQQSFGHHDHIHKIWKKRKAGMQRENLPSCNSICCVVVTHNIVPRTELK